MVRIITSATVLILATGAGDALLVSEPGSPLMDSLGSGLAAEPAKYIGLADLVASFFSVIYAYSRQLSPSPARATSPRCCR
ncbi:MAG: hypothetical protein R2768_03035 [Gordonia sp. (in: high G+C Gram-positive bacteria)]